MNRRQAIVLTVSALTVPPATAQALPGKIGYIHQRTITPDHTTLVTLRTAWSKLGYIEGRSVFLRTPGDDLTKVQAIIAELEREGVGVLIVVGGNAIAAAAKATKNLPIVAIDLETDPVRDGLAASLSRPGGNITGLFLDQSSLAGKWLDLLAEAVPNLSRIALLWDPATGPEQLVLALEAARKRSMAAVVVEVPRSDAVSDAFRKLAEVPGTGAVQLTSPGSSVYAVAIAEAALRYGIPMISFLTSLARAGALLGYGPDQDVYFRRAVTIARKILGGERAGEIPIERPDRFQLIVNMKTARALGLIMPPAVLAGADEVIE